MAKLFARFSEVAAENPYAQFPIARDEDFLATPSKENYEFNIPYNKWFIAQDAVNQGAAVVMTSVGKAQELGVPEDQWIYLHGYADADDTWVSQRPELSASNAIKASAEQALTMAGKSVEEMVHLDIYSCFPIAVLAGCEAMGIDWKTEKPLTVTGGLPFFGGAGNNYSLHAIAEICTRLRKAPGEFGMVSANGGYLSKQSIGIYSTTSPEDWQPAEANLAQKAVDRQRTVEVLKQYNGEAVIESYSLVYMKGQPKLAFMIARVAATGQRVLAKAAKDDGQTLLELQQEDDPIGRKVTVQSIDKDGFFSFTNN